jgi:hypothetical protein
MSSISFELAHRQRWSGLIARCLLHPDEVPLQDELGLTVLHWACINTPTAHVIEALVHHDPTQSICGIKDFNDMTPLQCACFCVADIYVMMTLLRASPPSVLDIDHRGWTCLHYIFSWSESDPEEITFDLETIVRMLLLADKTHKLATLADHDGSNPLNVLWHRIAHTPATRWDDLQTKYPTRHQANIW